MLEHDITKRANMAQVSKSTWLKQEITDTRNRISVEEDGLFGLFKIKSVGTQTECICIYDSLRFSSEGS